LSSTILLVSAPIILGAALCIRLESKGNPFFFQVRLGKGGKPFKIFKLRGMYADARDRFPHLYDYGCHNSLNFYFHLDNDPRITRVGAITRRLSIDELPNLWNVLIGDMSLVGPRPEIPEILSLYGPYKEKYLSVKPGLTCFSKITGRDHLTKLESIVLDIAYVDQRKPTTDIAIFVKTFQAVILGRDVRG
jgi:lipopolysaccharide/colanic/teichoic acid biosynthesis glycosyltransferase